MVAQRQTLVEQLTGLDSRFWIVNLMEMFERLAYYGVRAVVAIYMVLALEEGGPEHLATLARKGQEGLFMGYAHVPLAIGWVAGSILAGNAYEERGDKVNLARKHLVEELGRSPESVDALQKTDVMPTLAEALGTSTREAQTLLFETYQPDQIWWGIAGIGVLSIFRMVAYDRVIRRLDDALA